MSSVICDIYENQTFSAERALYGKKNILLRSCTFAGEEDGESALKESRGVTADGCLFALRYPLWHAEDVRLTGCRMEESCRAAVWYARNFSAEDCGMHGIKAVRECVGVSLTRCDILSPEFGWSSRRLSLTDCRVTGEYAFLRASDGQFDGLTLDGKYSFQYTENFFFSHSTFTTKDAFWHAKNITVTDSVVRGEYLGWYSENLRFVRCRLIGTQPLCYARGLVLEDCVMENADRAFEKSEVRADLGGRIESVKAPLAGEIVADEIGEVLRGDDGAALSGACVIRTR